MIALSTLVMVFLAAMSNARLVLAYPVLTRVFGVDDSTKFEGRGAGGEPAPDDAERDAQDALRAAKRRGGGLLPAYDRFVDRLNGMTSAWVPNAWLEGAVRGAATHAEEAAARAKRRDQFATLWTVLLLFLAATGAVTVGAFLHEYVNEAVRLRILMDVRTGLTARLLDQPMAYYDAARRGDVVQRVLDDVHGFATGLKVLLGGLVEGVAYLAIGLVFLLLLSPGLVLVCLLGVPLFLPFRALTRKIRKRARKRQASSARRVETLLQVVTGIRTIKAFRSEARKVDEFRDADREVTRQSLKVQRTKSTADALTEFLNYFLTMALIVGGGFLMLRGVLGIGPATVFLFLGLLVNLYKPAKGLIKDFNAMNDAMASVDRVFEVLDLPGVPPDPPGAVDFPGVRDAVRFERVGFSYKPGQPVLSDVTFEIPKGATVALVGPSGAGKSTLCDLLLRFYDPTEGRIAVDGKPLHAFRRASYLDRTAVVTQEPFLFHTSVADNIRQGRFSATDAEVEEAARAAQIHDHVASLPQGYATEVGERGARLSGGQRQRVTIARALVRDPEILVLDEATSSLDTQSERAVKEALDRLRAGRTTLVVAHRLSTVKEADRIVVLDDGRVVDQGTHEELLSRGGLYARLCALQDLGSPPEPEPAPVADPDAPGGEAPDAPPGTA
jgi:subfamily B ATP-binding cassette protein MsbA